MGLSPAERQRLDAIEDQLSSSDPHLAAMFARWTTTGIRGRFARTFLWNRASPGEFVRILVIVGALAAVIGLAIAGVLTASFPTPTGHPQHSTNRAIPASRYQRAPAS